MSNNRKQPYDGFVNLELKKRKIDYILYNMITNLQEEYIKNQVMAIVNYEDNNAKGEYLMAAFFANCSMIIKQNIGNKEDDTWFKKSLDESLGLINNYSNAKRIYKKLKRLQEGNSKSFLLVPIVTKGHVFSSVITKNIEGNYEVVLVNKGERENHFPFEKYELSKENMKKICKMYASMDYKYPSFNRTVGNIYYMFEKYSKKHEELDNVDARNQIVGNCYYKEIEEGLKYAYSNAYNGFEIQNDRKIPKFPISLKEFHERLLHNIKEVIDIYINYNVINREKYCEGLISFIDDIIKVYGENKRFRECLKRLDDTNYKARKEAIFKEFDVKDNNFEEFKTKVLNNIDKSTLSEHIGFFVEILKENNVYIPEDIMGVKSSIEKIYVLNYKIKLEKIIRENNLEMFTFLEQNFPQIGKELIDKYIYKINILLSSEYKLWSDLLVEEKSLIKREEYENFKSRDISFYEKKKIIGVLNKRNLTMEQILELEYIVREYLTDCRKRNEILDSINKELRVTPNNIGLIKSKEKILKTLNANSKEMLEDYTRFLEQSPGNKEIREKRARVFLKIGDYKLAVREYKMLGEDIDINTKKDMIEALAKSGNIKEAVHEYIPILKAPKCTLKDVKSALYLLMQQKEIDKETSLFFRELLDKKDKEVGKVIPSKMKFINKFFKKKKLDEFKTLKLMCLDFFEFTKDYNKALEVCDDLIDIYNKLGLGNRIIYMGNIKYRKAEILEALKRDDEALEEMLLVLQNKDLRINRKVLEKIKTLSKKGYQDTILKAKLNGDREIKAIIVNKSNTYNPNLC